MNANEIVNAYNDKADYISYNVTGFLPTCQIRPLRTC